MGDALDGEGAGLGVERCVNGIPLNCNVRNGTVRMSQMRGLRQRRSHTNRCLGRQRVNGLHSHSRGVCLQHLLVLGAGHGQHGSVARLAAIGVGREVRLRHLIADNGPLTAGDILSRHRHIVVWTLMIARLVGEQVVLVAVHIAIVGLE